jgi:hypothetical protein
MIQLLSSRPAESLKTPSVVTFSICIRRTHVQYLTMTKEERSSIGTRGTHGLHIVLHVRHGRLHGSRHLGGVVPVTSTMPRIEDHRNFF